MPVGLQPCSSSPISPRVGSAEIVVFPVPERPKNRAVTPSAPTLAEQCMGKTSRSGNRKFRGEKIDFFISPAYPLPQTRTSLREKLTAINASERLPSRLGSVNMLGTPTTVNSGL